MDEEFYIPGFTNDLTSSAQNRSVAQPMQTAADYGNYDFSNLNLGNLDFGGWGAQNFVPDFSAQTAAYQPQVTAAPTAYQSHPTPQPVQTAAYTPDALAYQSVPTVQPTTTAPYSGDATTPSAAPTFNFSPEEQAKFATALKNAQAQYAAVNDPAYLANQQAKDEWLKQQYQQGNYYTPAYDPLDFAANSGGILNLFAPTTKPAFDPNNPTANMQQVYYFDTGVKGGSPDPYTGEMTYKNAGPVPYYPGVTTTMYDAKGNVIGSASTPEEMKKLADLSNTVGVYTLRQSGTPTGPLATSYGSAGSLPTKTDAGSLSSMLLNMAALALPAVGGAVLGPALAGAGGLGIGVSAPVGVGLGTAAGTAASGALAGKSLKDILLQSALSGLTAGGLSALTTPGVPGAGVDPTAQYIKTLTGVDVPSSVFGGASFGGAGGGGGGGSFAGTDAGGNFIQVLGSAGSKIPTSFLSGALNAAGTALSGANYGDRVWGDQSANTETNGTDTGDNEIVAEGRPLVDEKGIPIGYGSTITAEGTPQAKPNKYTATLPDLFSPLNSVDIPEIPQVEPEMPPADDNEIVVKAPPRAPDLLPVFVPPLNSVNIPPADTFKPSDTKSDLDKLIEKIRAASTAAGALGGLFGGGGAGAGGYAGMRGPLNAIFSAKLPTANLGTATPRAVNFDAYRYGYGPEQSFFSHVPQGAPNTSTAYTGYETSPRYNAGQQYAADIAALLNAPQSTSAAQSTTSQTTATQPATTQSAASIPVDEARLPSGALSNVVASQSSTATSIPHTPGAPIPGLSKAQQLYYDRIANGPTIDKAQYDYVKGLSDYQALASLSNYDSLLGSTIYNGENGFRTMDELEAYYKTPLYTYGGDQLRKSNLPGYAKGGKVHENLSYDDLTPEEKNFVDYHRRNMAVNPLEQDGSLTTVYGMIDPVGGGQMLHPGYVHGRIMDRDAATDWARHSGIDFPIYPDAATAIKREQSIHRDIIEPDTERYQRGDRAWLEGYAEGGYAVGGPGDGRDDKIPAMLSDGEYVMDAETVALLGNGSPKAGADMLDKFRVNVRKHKGRDLAKGKFSANAKKPEQYLKGRK